MARRVSIRDVAAAAGVSLTTVSHVLNDVDGARIADETRVRVRETAIRLGYTPSRMARGLRTQRSGTVGLLSDHIATTPHAGKIILGAQEAGLEQGWLLLMFNTGGDPELEQRDVEVLRQHQAEGVLYASMYHRVVTPSAGLAAMPTVLLDARCDDPRIPSVVPDETGGAQVAVAELARHGHRRIGFCTNRDDIPATHGRLAGYRDSLRQSGIAFDPQLVVAAESEAAGGYLAARQLLTRADPPTALFCFNDRMAMGAYRAAAELGLRIPVDLSIVGFDDQEIISTGLFPALTTVSLPHYEMGRWALLTLLELIDSGGEARPGEVPHLMPCPLVVRDSVGPPPR